MKTSYNPNIFREYDIRGIADKELPDELSRDLGQHLAQDFRRVASARKEKRERPLVSVGRDCRLSSPRLATAMIDGLTSAGIDVLDLGVCPTPLSYFSVFHFDLDGSVMITGSHNPAEFNGFKTCVGKETIHGAAIQELRKRLETSAELGTGHNTSGTSDTSGIRGTVRPSEVIAPYIDYVVANITPRVADFPRKKKIKVVLDAGNGTASTVAPELFRRLGADVVPLYCELDGRFPNHHPDPTVLKNLEAAIQAVQKEKADFGVAFDGDSDRIGAIDETGRPLFGDELMVVFSRAVLAEKPGAAIISEVKSSHRLYQDIAENGGKPIMWKTGHSLIKAKLKESNAALAGEMSGHVFFADRYFGYDDALYSAARLFEIVSRSKDPLSIHIADLVPVVATPEIRLDCSDDLKFKIVESTKELLAKERKVNDIDGVRVDYGYGWGLVRASNTQPVLVLRFEAEDERRMAEIQNEFYTALNRAALGLGYTRFSREPTEAAVTH